MTNAHSKLFLGEQKDEFIDAIEREAISLIEDLNRPIAIDIDCITMKDSIYTKAQFICEMFGYFITKHDKNDKMTNKHVLFTKKDDGLYHVKVMNSCEKLPIKKSQMERLCPCGNWGPALLFKKCGKCKDIYYCSKACQVADWAKHKLHCIKKD